MCIQSAQLIAINSNSTRGRQVFSLAHELYHYYYDQDYESISYIEFDSKSNSKESDANRFASYLLMPDASFSQMVERITSSTQGNINLLSIIELEQYFKVSRSAVLTRLLSEKWISQEDLIIYQRDIVRHAKMYGFDTALYEKNKNNDPKTYGAYLKLALALKEKGIISEGKYESYLIDAYRSDIVFDEGDASDSDE